MDNIKMNFKYSGISDHEIDTYSEKVKRIHKELNKSVDDKNNFTGWIDWPINYDKKEYDKIKKIANKIKSDSDVLVVIGIGGSYLGARAIIEALSNKYDRNGNPEIIYVGNNLNPNYINEIIDYISNKDISINVISKSGKTTEPAIAFRIFRNLLEDKYGVGFHTISMPRLKPAAGVTLKEFPNLVDDEMFKKLVAIIRIAVPFTGIIMSTRETEEMRRELLRYGVSQISAGSSTGVGGYKEREEGKYDSVQFKTSDDRTPLDVIKSVLDDGYIPSYCTACYRRGRTGERFMKLAKSGEIQNVCEPNAITTLLEFAIDYGDKEILEKAEAVINREKENIKRKDIKELLEKNLERLRAGERDLYL